MDESAIQRFILRRCLRNAPSYLISATYRICHLEKFSTWNKFSSRTHTSTTSSVLIGCSGFWSGERRQSGSTDPLAPLLRGKADHLVLAGPFGWQVGEAGNSHPMREPPVDGGLDEIGREEG